jgi:hypothetical protein
MLSLQTVVVWSISYSPGYFYLFASLSDITGMIQKQGNTEAVPVGERERRLLFFLITIYHTTYSKSMNLIFNVKSKNRKSPSI